MLEFDCLVLLAGGIRDTPIADCRLPIADCRLPIADCRLPIVTIRHITVGGKALEEGF